VRYIKHLSVALMAIGLSAPVMADSILSVPSQHGGFKLAVDPLYLRNSPGSNISDSSYDWGVFAQVGYLFPATGNDLTVDYTCLRSGTTESMDLDAADLEIGQRLTSGAFDLRLFSGLRYAHLNYSLDMGNQQPSTSLYHGFGPRMGADARYQLGCSCFGLDTHLNTSLLAGSVSSKSAKLSESMNRVVPELDAKLGVDYTSPVSRTDKSAFVVEVGYQTSNYFSALNSNVVSGSGDANLDGVYAEVKYYS
jgi:hypothetical protein